MGGTFRARVSRGLLEPLEKVELPEGKEVTVTIVEIASDRDFEAFRRSFGGWKGTIDAEDPDPEYSRESSRPEPRL